MPTDGEGTVLVVAIDGREVALGDLCDAEPFVALEAVARLHLAAKRSGASVRVRTTNPALVALLDAIGLAELVQCDLGGCGDQASRRSGNPKYGNSSG
jgi:hypothetical protein